jgi:hypothetical protein
MLRLPKKPYTLAGLELGYSVPEADAMTTAPLRQGNLHFFIFKKINKLGMNSERFIQSIGRIYKSTLVESKNLHR